MPGIISPIHSELLSHMTTGGDGSGRSRPGDGYGLFSFDSERCTSKSMLQYILNNLYYGYEEGGEARQFFVENIPHTTPLRYSVN